MCVSCERPARSVYSDPSVDKHAALKAKDIANSLHPLLVPSTRTVRLRVSQSNIYTYIVHVRAKNILIILLDTHISRYIHSEREARVRDTETARNGVLCARTCCVIGKFV